MILEKDTLKVRKAALYGTTDLNVFKKPSMILLVTMAKNNLCCGTKDFVGLIWDRVTEFKHNVHRNYYAW